MTGRDTATHAGSPCFLLGGEDDDERARERKNGKRVCEREIVFNKGETRKRRHVALRARVCVYMDVSEGVREGGWK